jgi:hypothetical protein
MEESLIELPKGYTVEYDETVGYSFKNHKGRIVVQHPKDNNSIRKLIWILDEKLMEKGL